MSKWWAEVHRRWLDGVSQGKIINGEPVTVESDELERLVGFSCSALSLAEQFHATYERLAPSFGYETRPETREFDCESPNGKLMIAVCESIIQQNSVISTNNCQSVTEGEPAKATYLEKREGRMNTVCPECKGSGIISYNPNCNPNSFIGTVTAKCRVCCGTGMITSENE